MSIILLGGEGVKIVKRRSVVRNNIGTIGYFRCIYWGYRNRRIVRKNELLNDRRNDVRAVKLALYRWYSMLRPYKYRLQKGMTIDLDLFDGSGEKEYVASINMLKDWLNEEQWQVLHNTLIVFRNTYISIWNMSDKGKLMPVCWEGEKEPSRKIDWNEVEKAYNSAQKLLDNLRKSMRL